MTTKPLKKKRKVDLPYWPSQDFIEKCVKLAREGGDVGDHEDLVDRIHTAYWKKRAEILAKELVP